jgi:hypothetical protein
MEAGQPWTASGLCNATNRKISKPHRKVIEIDPGLVGRHTRQRLVVAAWPLIRSVLYCLAQLWTNISRRDDIASKSMVFVSRPKRIATSSQKDHGPGDVSGAFCATDLNGARRGPQPLQGPHSFAIYHVFILHKSPSLSLLLLDFHLLVSWSSSAKPASCSLRYRLVSETINACAGGGIRYLRTSKSVEIVE